MLFPHVRLFQAVRMLLLSANPAGDIHCLIPSVEMLFSLAERFLILLDDIGYLLFALRRVSTDSCRLASNYRALIHSYAFEHSQSSIFRALLGSRVLSSGALLCREVSLPQAAFRCFGCVAITLLFRVLMGLDPEMHVRRLVNGSQNLVMLLEQVLRVHHFPFSFLRGMLIYHILSSAFARFACSLVFASDCRLKTSHSRYILALLNCGLLQDCMR